MQEKQTHLSESIPSQDSLEDFSPLEVLSEREIADTAAAAITGDLALSALNAVNTESGTIYSDELGTANGKNGPIERRVSVFNPQSGNVIDIALIGGNLRLSERLGWQENTEGEVVSKTGQGRTLGLDSDGKIQERKALPDTMDLVTLNSSLASSMAIGEGLASELLKVPADEQEATRARQLRNVVKRVARQNSDQEGVPTVLTLEAANRQLKERAGKQIRNTIFAGAAALSVLGVGAGEMISSHADSVASKVALEQAMDHAYPYARITGANDLGIQELAPHTPGNASDAPISEEVIELTFDAPTHDTTSEGYSYYDQPTVGERPDIDIGVAWKDDAKETAIMTINPDVISEPGTSISTEVQLGATGETPDGKYKVRSVWDVGTITIGNENGATRLKLNIDPYNANVPHTYTSATDGSDKKSAGLY
jgi:hypothetical protein